MTPQMFYIRGVRPDGVVVNYGNRARSPGPMDKGGAERMMSNFVSWMPDWTFSVEPYSGQKLTPYGQTSPVV